MADLIDRQAALDILKFKPIDDGGVVDDCIMQVLALAKSKVSKLPAVDAVEVPCKVDNTVYSMLDDLGRLHECKVCGIYIGSKEWKSYVELEPIDYRGRRYGAAFGAFGKTVFLTREEAENALAERREENAAD